MQDHIEHEEAWRGTASIEKSIFSHMSGAVTPKSHNNAPTYDSVTAAFAEERKFCDVQLLIVSDLHITPAVCAGRIQSMTDAICQMLVRSTVDCVFFLGDIFQHFERVHYAPLAEFTELLVKIRTFVPHIVIIAGNHDMANNQQYMVHKGTVLTSFGAIDGVQLVECAEVVTVFHRHDIETYTPAMDPPMKSCCRRGHTHCSTEISENGYHRHAHILCVPYVPPGRFHEAVQSAAGGHSVNCVALVLGHQTINGCKFGHASVQAQWNVRRALTDNGSEKNSVSPYFAPPQGDSQSTASCTQSDPWPQGYPLLISGHIHEQQIVAQNIIYPGSSLPTERDVHGFDNMANVTLLSLQATTSTHMLLHNVCLSDVPTPRKIILSDEDCCPLPSNRGGKYASLMVRTLLAHIQRPGNTDAYNIPVDHSSASAMQFFDTLPLVQQLRALAQQRGVTARIWARLRAPPKPISIGQGGAVVTTRKRGGASVIECTSDLIQQFTTKNVQLQTIKKRPHTDDGVAHLHDKHVVLYCPESQSDVSVTARSVLAVYTERFLESALSKRDDLSRSLLNRIETAVTNTIYK